MPNTEQGFKDVVRKIAKKKGWTVAQVQEKIASSKGPVIHATKAEYSRFHDDKDTYTGAHGAIHGREGHDDGRHEAQQASAAKDEEANEDEHPWDDVMVAY